MSAHVPCPWPLQDLAALVGGREGLNAVFGTRQVARAYARGGLSDMQADTWAVRCGCDPYIVWPALLDQAIAAVEKPCARPDCTAVFVPHDPRMRYCTPHCQQTETNRRRRKRPDVAAAARESAARYRAENPDYCNRAAAAYRERNREAINARERDRYQARKATA